MENTLLIFLKYPEPGTVKTRLAKGIGKKNAAELYKLFVENILRNTADKRYNRLIAYTPSNKKKDFITWLGKDIKLYPQNGKNLGERLSSTFRYAFTSGAKRVVAIGTDSPFLDKKTVVRAFKNLEGNDVTIGPSRDGGYYLIGLSRFHRDIFRGIDWGTDKVFNQTIGKIKRLKLQLKVMGEYFDVDDVEDLLLLNEKIKKGV